MERPSISDNEQTVDKLFASSSENEYRQPTNHITTENKKGEKKEELTLELRLAKQSITAKINRWKSAFPNITKDIKIKPTMTYDELVELEKQAEFTVSTSNGGAIIQTTVLGGAGIAEQFGPLYGLQLQGYQRALMSNDTFKKTLLELEVKYSDKLHTGVWGRLMSSMVYSASVIHLSNKQKLIAEMNNKLGNEMDNNLNEKYKDL